jgi:hypothetical protein
MLGKPALVPVAGLGLEPVDEVDDVIEPTTGTGPNAASGNGDGKMGRRARTASAVFKIYVLHPKKTFATISANFGVEQIADDALGLMLAFDGGSHDLIVSRLHAVELELAHEVEELSAFHQMVLLRLS